MIYAIIDPYLFHFDEQQRLPVMATDTLAELVATLYQREAYVPQDAFYWPMLVDRFLAPLRQRIRSDPAYKHLLQRLQLRACPVELPPIPSPFHVADAKQMFGHFGEDCVTTMEAILTGCALLGDTILVTRLLKGRNAQSSTHKDYAETFVEKTCWELAVEIEGEPFKRIPCVCTRRNLEVPWTCRYADALPAHEDGGKCPFYPPDNWNDASVVVAPTHKSRPTWSDTNNLYWAEPAAQQANNKSYHWDVYLDKNIAIMEGMLGKKFKKTKNDPYLNVVKWRGNASSDGQGTSGDIHHPPAAKNKPGWRR